MTRSRCLFYMLFIILFLCFTGCDQSTDASWMKKNEYYSVEKWLMTSNHSVDDGNGETLFGDSAEASIHTTQSLSKTQLLNISRYEAEQEKKNNEKIIECQFLFTGETEEKITLKGAELEFIAVTEPSGEETYYSDKEWINSQK